MSFMLLKSVKDIRYDIFYKSSFIPVVQIFISRTSQNLLNRKRCKLNRSKKVVTDANIMIRLIKSDARAPFQKES